MKALGAPHLSAAIVASLCLSATLGNDSPVLVLEPAQADLHSLSQTCTAAGGASIFYAAQSVAAEGPSEAFITYNFSVPETGCYLVEEQHPSQEDAKSCGISPFAHVPVQIGFYRGGVKQTSIDQTISEGAWQPVASVPFHKSFSNQVTISRPANASEPQCPEGQCVCMASSFRLTWVAPTCSEIESAETALIPVETEEDALETIGNDGEKDQELHGGVVDRTRGVQLNLGDADVFLVPFSGCYMIEEQHRHDPDATWLHWNLMIEYGLGKRASGVLSHIDGQHDQWNYVATLPFYQGFVGSIMLWKPASGQRFRLTYTGCRCETAVTEVQRMEIRMAADFAKVADKISDFKVKLASILASSAQMDNSRLAVTHLREGSVIAEVILKPWGAGYGGPLISARGAARALQFLLSVERSILGDQLCQAIDGSLTGCTVTVLNTGVAAPLVRPVEQTRAEEPEEAGPAPEILGIPMHGPIIVAMAIAACGTVVHPAEEELEEEEKADDEMSNGRENLDLRDDTSTITPEMEDRECGETTSELSAGIRTLDGSTEESEVAASNV